jgi:membrane associated rhomboid family serine protease
MFLRVPPAIKNLIIINVLMYLATLTLGSYGKGLDTWLALYYFKSPNFHVYQYITYMFMHGGFFHLFFNMYALFMFGSVLEQYWGSKRFLIFYFVTGIGAALFYTLVNYIEFVPMIRDFHAFINTPNPELLRSFIKAYYPENNGEIITFMNKWAELPKNSDYINDAIAIVQKIVSVHFNNGCVGASGAIFGVLLGFGMLFPNTELMLLFPPIPIKAKYFVMIYGGIELYLAISQPGSSIAHSAHLGGMLFGFIMIKMWSKDRKNFY